MRDSNFTITIVALKNIPLVNIILIYIQLVTTVHTMSLYRQLLQCLQCHYIHRSQLLQCVQCHQLVATQLATVVQSHSYNSVNFVTMQLVTQLYTTVYTVSLNMHNITMDSQLAVQPDYLSQLATVCTVTLHLCIYSAYSITIYHACILLCMYKVSQCTTVQLYGYVATASYSYTTCSVQCHYVCRYHAVCRYMQQPLTQGHYNYTTQLQLVSDTSYIYSYYVAS